MTLGYILSVMYTVSMSAVTLMGIGVIIYAAVIAYRNRTYLILLIIGLEIMAIISTIGLGILGII